MAKPKDLRDLPHPQDRERPVSPQIRKEIEKIESQIGSVVDVHTRMYAMAEFWYLEHYYRSISPHLTDEQKLAIAQRISNLTLHAPIWMMRQEKLVPIKGTKGWNEGTASMREVDLTSSDPEAETTSYRVSHTGQKDADYRDQFPELAPFVSEGAGLSGLNLIAIMEGIMKDLHPEYTTMPERWVGPSIEHMVREKKKREQPRPKVRGRIRLRTPWRLGRGWHREHKRHVEAGIRGARERR